MSYIKDNFSLMSWTQINSKKNVLQEENALTKGIKSATTNNNEDFCIDSKLVQNLAYIQNNAAISGGAYVIYPSFPVGSLEAELSDKPEDKKTIPAIVLKEEPTETDKQLIEFQTKFEIEKKIYESMHQEMLNKTTELKKRELERSAVNEELTRLKLKVEEYKKTEKDCKDRISASKEMLISYQNNLNKINARVAKEESLLKEIKYLNEYRRILRRAETGLAKLPQEIQKAKIKNKTQIADYYDSYHLLIATAKDKIQELIVYNGKKLESESVELFENLISSNQKMIEKDENTLELSNKKIATTMLDINAKQLKAQELSIEITKQEDALKQLNTNYALQNNKYNEAKTNYYSFLENFDRLKLKNDILKNDELSKEVARKNNFLVKEYLDYRITKEETLHKEKLAKLGVTLGYNEAEDNYYINTNDQALDEKINATLIDEAIFINKCIHLYNDVLDLQLNRKKTDDVTASIDDIIKSCENNISIKKEFETIKKAIIGSDEFNKEDVSNFSSKSSYVQ